MAKCLMLGNEAVARGAYEAGVRVGTAYPGTPSTEIMECLARHEGVYCEWSSNEKVALEVGLGAAIAGARSIVSMTECCGRPAFYIGIYRNKRRIGDSRSRRPRYA